MTIFRAFTRADSTCVAWGLNGETTGGLRRLGPRAPDPIGWQSPPATECPDRAGVSPEGFANQTGPGPWRWPPEALRRVPRSAPTQRRQNHHLGPIPHRRRQTAGVADALPVDEHIDVLPHLAQLRDHAI